jgi:VWFA-related protein
VIEFAAKLIRDGNEVMLAALRTDGRMGIIAPFTKDLHRLRILLNQAQGGADRELMIDRNMDELSRVMENGGDEAIDQIQAGYRYARVLATQEKDLSEYSLKAVQAFAEYLSKENLQDAAVIYVSGGFSVDPGRQYYQIVDDFANSNDSSAPGLLSVSINRDANLDLRNEIEQTFSRINRLNVTFYTIDTVGLGGAGEYQDSLAEMAEQTGGISFYNSQNYNLGFGKVLNDVSHQYLLCFQAPEHKNPSETHRIKVVVKRPDVEVRHRKGYSES